MKRRSLFALLPFLAATPALAQTAKPKPAAGKQRVIFQVSDNDPGKWQLALNNAQNVQADLGKENVEIEIVAYGPGLGMLKAESKVAGGLAGALDNNVGLIACENTMHNTKVSRDDMYRGGAFVIRGATRIINTNPSGAAHT